MRIESQQTVLSRATWSVTTDADVETEDGPVLISSIATQVGSSWAERIEQDSPATLILDALGLLVIDSGRPTPVGGPTDALAFLIEDLIVASGPVGGWTLSAQSELQDAVLGWPVPVFGSPPDDWKSILSLVASESPFTAMSGMLIYQHQPALALLAGTVGVVVWFTRPALVVLRKHFADQVEKKLRPPAELQPPATRQ